MDFEHYILVGTLTLGLVLWGLSFRINPISLWIDLVNYFGGGLDASRMRSRIDRQRDFVLLACFLIFVGIPAAILIWFT